MADDTLRALRTLVKLQQTTVLLQRFALLGEARVVRFTHSGKDIALHTPQGDRDLVQGHIVNTAGFYEQKLLADLLDEALVPADGILIDAGANIGNHTVFFAKFFSPKRVYAFEPQPKVFEVLEKNIALNALTSQVSLVNAALGATTGRSSLSRARADNLGAASFAQEAHGDFPLTTLDTIVPKSEHGRITFIKIDVEGNELAVLQGAQSILAKSRPLLWVEVLPRNKGAIDDDLAALGYSSRQLNRSNHLFIPGDR